MDNDARLAVAGEWWQGAARGKNNVVMMTIGTGIGTGVVIDGRLLYGQHFQAGSLGGHFVLDYKGRRCSCGNKGCVEALSSSFFLPTIVREHALLSESFKRDAAWCPSGKVPIVPAILGDDAALFGLEYFMVKQQQNERICI